LVKSPKFDLTKTYFLIAGIAGVNPKVATLGSVAFAKYAIQIALQYEFDAREVCRVCSGPSYSSPAQF
jgi:purine nucleoside permease